MLVHGWWLQSIKIYFSYDDIHPSFRPSVCPSQIYRCCNSATAGPISSISSSIESSWPVDLQKTWSCACWAFGGIPGGHPNFCRCCNSITIEPIRTILCPMKPSWSVDVQQHIIGPLDPCGNLLVFAFTNQRHRQGTRKVVLLFTCSVPDLITADLRKNSACYDTCSSAAMPCHVDIL